MVLVKLPSSRGRKRNFWIQVFQVPKFIQVSKASQANPAGPSLVGSELAKLVTLLFQGQRFVKEAR